MDRQIMERWRKVAAQYQDEQDQERREQLIREMDRIILDAIRQASPKPNRGRRKTAAA
jgi:cytochrome c551/c552